MVGGPEFLNGLARADDGPAIAIDHHLRGQRAVVIGGAHHHAIGPAIQQGHARACFHVGQGAVVAEGIAAFAHGADHMHRLDRSRRSLGRKREDAVPGIIQAGAHEVVHGRIEHQEGGMPS